MRSFERYMVFIIYAMGTIIIVTCDGDDNQQFYNDMLQLYTKYRIKHGAQALDLDNKISQDTMNYLKLWIEGKEIQPNGDTYCQIYKSKSTEKMTAKTIFFFWYNEGKLYDYNGEPKNYKTEHFTQILWRSSKKVGFAFLYTNNINYFAACYSPRGNILGEYVKNVKKPKNDRNINHFALFMD